MDDGQLGGADYRKAPIVCQRMERVCLFCQVRDSKCAIINPKDGMWLAHPQNLRNDFVRIIARASIEAGSGTCGM